MKKQKQFDKVAAVKSASRIHIGTLPKAKVIPDKKKKALGARWHWRTR